MPFFVPWLVDVARRAGKAVLLAAPAEQLRPRPAAPVVLSLLVGALPAGAAATGAGATTTGADTSKWITG